MPVAAAAIAPEVIGAGATAGGLDLASLLPMLSGMGGSKGGGKKGGGNSDNLKSGALGIIQSVAAMRASKKARGLRPSNVDPQEQAMNAELNMIRKNRGSGVQYKEALRQLSVQTANAAEDVVGASGGASGAAIAGLAELEQAAGDSFGKIFSAGASDHFFDTAYQDSTNSMIKRRADLQMNDYSNALSEALNLKQAGMSNILNAVAGTPDAAEPTSTTPTRTSGKRGVASFLDLPTPGLEDGSTVTPPVSQDGGVDITGMLKPSPGLMSTF